MLSRCCSADDECDRCYDYRQRVAAERRGARSCIDGCGRVVERDEPDSCEWCRMEDGRAMYCADCESVVVDSDDVFCAACANASPLVEAVRVHCEVRP